MKFTKNENIFSMQSHNLNRKICGLITAGKVIFAKKVVKYIYQTAGWPHFCWDGRRIDTLLNIWLDGYSGKLNIKNWAKMANVSPNTAARDIRDLVAKDILIPEQGRIRNIAYGIKCNDKIIGNYHT